jgi:hypothetical protein
MLIKRTYLNDTSCKERGVNHETVARTAKLLEESELEYTLILTKQPSLKVSLAN